jgi:hypothetical protein
MKTQVIEVKEAPDIKVPDIVQGVRDKQAAKAWGEKKGYDIVYYIARKQKVYANRLMVRVDVQSRESERASVDLLAMVESAK